MISSTQTNHPLAGSAPANSSVEEPLSTRDAICARLRNAGLRSTQPRIAIYKVLNELSEPATIEQIFRALKSTNCDLVTVYRGLALFEELGLVRRSFSNNGTGLYQLKREGAPSYYISSKASDARQSLDPQDAKELHELIRRIEAKFEAQGFSVVNHRLEFEARFPQDTAPVNVESLQN
jgi:Fur family transcriptional regulator, ferric uptake regulator